MYENKFVIFKIIFIKSINKLLHPKSIKTFLQVINSDVTCTLISFFMEFIMALSTKILSLMLLPFLPPTLLSVKF